MSDGFRDLNDAANEAVRRADQRLEDQLDGIRKLTDRELESLKPKIEMQDRERFEQLVKAVRESSEQNDELTDFRRRVKHLIEDGGEFLGKVGKLALKAKGF